jgi:AcrR family transcriptional regulator
MPEPHRRREELLATAVASIRKLGPAVSMEQLAAEAGVAKPILYRAFGSKEGLYQAVADWFRDQLLLDVNATIEARLELGTFVHRLTDAVLRRVESDAAIYHFLMRRARMALSSTSSPPEADFVRRFGDAVADLMAAELVKARLDPAPAPVWAHGLVGFVGSVADWSLDHRDVPRGLVATWASDVLCHGFAPQLG